MTIYEVENTYEHTLRSITDEVQEGSISGSVAAENITGDLNTLRRLNSKNSALNFNDRADNLTARMGLNAATIVSHALTHTTIFNDWPAKSQRYLVDRALSKEIAALDDFERELEGRETHLSEEQENLSYESIDRRRKELQKSLVKLRVKITPTPPRERI